MPYDTFTTHSQSVRNGSAPRWPDEPVDIALELAAAGLPVFPCNAAKEPLVKNGYLDATTDPTIIKKMFGRAAKLIGVPTGEASGFDVLDFDYRHGARDWEEANLHHLPETRTHSTMSGGQHLLFRYDPRVRNSAGRIAPGVDVRGGGGYVVMPPSDGYSVIADAPLADWPEWLLQPGLVLPQPPKERPVSSGTYAPLSNRRFEGWRESVLKNVRAAAEGQKHERLRNAALALGHIQDEIGFSEEEAVQWLMEALPASVKDWTAAAKTARWGLGAGRDDPRPLEDRPRDNYKPNGKAPPPPPRDPDPPPHPGYDDASAEPQAPPAEPVKPGVPFGRLRVLSVNDALNAPPRTYLLEGLIAPAEMSVWWGPPKSGKSFLALRLAYGLAQGIGMWGREAVKAPVLYVAAEGERAIGNRLCALNEKLGYAPNFQWIAQSVDMFDPDADLPSLIEAIRFYGSKVIALDTLARVMKGGDESQTRDMNVLIANCDRLREETGVHVMIIHHGGWDGAHARGSIALVAAADLVVKVSGKRGEPHSAQVEYAKDDQDGDRLGFDLEMVDLPPDAEGRPRSTCIAAEASEPISRRKDESRLKDIPKDLLGKVRDAMIVQGEPVEPAPGMALETCLSRVQLRDHLIASGWFSDAQLSKQNQSRTSGDEALLLKAGEKNAKPTRGGYSYETNHLTHLKNKGFLAFNRHWVWLLDPRPDGLL